MQPIVNISVYNQASTPLGLNLNILVAALQKYVDDFVAPIWGTPAKLTATNGPVSGTWGFVFLDDADAPGALAYHTVEDGLPIAKIFVRTILENGETLSSGSSHELVEMLVDPTCSLTMPAPNGDTYAYEAADPVEENVFDVDGFQMSNFVYPCFFQSQQDGVNQYDQMKMLTAPFTLDKGGYQSLLKDGQWTEVFGSLEKQDRFNAEDRRGHRSEHRRLQTAIKVVG